MCHLHKNESEGYIMVIFQIIRGACRASLRVSVELILEMQKYVLHVSVCVCHMI